MCLRPNISSSHTQFYENVLKLNTHVISNFSNPGVPDIVTSDSELALTDKGLQEFKHYEVKYTVHSSPQVQSQDTGKHQPDQQPEKKQSDR